MTVSEHAEMTEDNSSLFFSCVLCVFIRSVLLEKWKKQSLYKILAYNNFVGYLYFGNITMYTFNVTLQLNATYLKIYICIYVFSRHFYPKRLTVHSGYTFSCQYLCSLGFEPTTFVLLKHCSTTEPHEHKIRHKVTSQLCNTALFKKKETKEQYQAFAFQFIFYAISCHKLCLTKISFNKS